jgi:hypothetical protein
VIIISTKHILDISVPLTDYEVGLLTHMAEEEPRYSIKGWEDDPESWAAITLARRGLLKSESTYVYSITEIGLALYKFAEQFKAVEKST